MTGLVRFRMKLARSRFRQFMADQPPSVVVMEACGSAHFWAREMMKLGHEVKLIAPQYVRPFVKRQKNDASDAEATVTAVQRPGMRFVAPKSEHQQALAVLFRVRERLVHQRTESVNALRAVLYEFTHIVPQGIGNVKLIDALSVQPNCDLPAVVRIECMDIVKKIKELSAKIDAKAIAAKNAAVAAETA